MADLPVRARTETTTETKTSKINLVWSVAEGSVGFAGASRDSIGGILGLVKRRMLLIYVYLPTQLC